MTFRYDQEADALSIELLKDVGIARTEQIDSGTLVDLDQRGRVVAIEVLRPARDWHLEDLVSDFQLDPEDVRMLEATFHESFPFGAEPELVG
jgi:uncharacterized protein YuzE